MAPSLASVEESVASELASLLLSRAPSARASAKVASVRAASATLASEVLEASWLSSSTTGAVEPHATATAERAAEATIPRENKRTSEKERATRPVYHRCRARAAAKSSLAPIAPA
jgi:hypothetical protein